MECSQPISDAIKNYRNVVISIVGKKIGWCYRDTYEDAYQNACIDLIASTDIIADTDILGYLLRQTWYYLSVAQVDRVKHKTITIDYIDHIEDTTIDDQLDMVMDAKPHREIIDYNKLEYGEIFRNTLPPKTKLIWNWRCEGITPIEMRSRLNVSLRYVAVVDYHIRLRYKKWIVEYIKNKDMFEKRLKRIKHKNIRDAAELVVQGYRSSAIADMLHIDKKLSWRCTHYARRYLAGERDPLHHTHSKHRLRVHKK